MQRRRGIGRAKCRKMGSTMEGGVRSKYDVLGRYLSWLGAPLVTLTFAEIEAILDCPLPPSARRSAEWWGATAGGRFQNAHAAHWLRAGYIADRPDFAAGTVMFRRVTSG